MSDHTDAARFHRAIATEMLVRAGADDLAAGIVEHIEAAAVASLLHRFALALRDVPESPAKYAIEQLLR
jgi:hypothetical protein